jgi:hypothetical protein
VQIGFGLSQVQKTWAIAHSINHQPGLEDKAMGASKTSSGHKQCRGEKNTQAIGDKKEFTTFKTRNF